MTGRPAPFMLAAAAVAALCVGALDFFVVIACFLGKPDPGGWLLGAGLVLALAAFPLRRAWLLFAAQNLVLVAAMAYSFRSGEDLRAAALAYSLGVVAIGNLLVWHVARVMPAARGRD